MYRLILFILIILFKYTAQNAGSSKYIADKEKLTIVDRASSTLLSCISEEYFQSPVKKKNSKAIVKQRITLKPQLSKQADIYSLSELRASKLNKNSAPKAVSLTDKGLPGNYILDANDTTTPDNRATTIVTASGLRYIFQSSGAISVERFGVVIGGGYGAATLNTKALNVAVNSGLPLLHPGGDIYTNGPVSTVGIKNVSIQGVGITSRFIHNTNETLFDFSSGVYGKIDGINICANGSFDGQATALIIKTRVGMLPSFQLSNVKIARIAGNQQWSKGLIIIDPDETIIENVIIEGVDSPTLKSKAPIFRGVEITNTRAAVSATFRNVKVYNGKEGFYLRSGTKPGIEGIKFYGCDAVGVDIGWDIASTADYITYLPPQILLQGCHVNAKVCGISLSNYIQGSVSDCIIYLMPIANTLAQGIVGKNVSQLRVTNTDITNNGFGSIYGVVIGGNGTVGARLKGMNIVMGNASKSNSAIILQSTASQSYCEDINRTGGNQTVFNSGANNTIGKTFSNGIVE